MIAPETRQSAVSNVSVWRQGGVCAPHKLLLQLYVLLQYKMGHPRLFNYGLEIHEPLTRLLKEFGPERRTNYPNMPFWRLRTDGFWEIVLRTYHSRCALCGYDLRLDGAPVGIEAAHIHWKAYGGPCVVNNGLALCTLHHDAFDRGAFGLDESMTIRISGGVSRSPVVDHLFWHRDGQPLFLPYDKTQWPAEQYVGWHRKQIFKA
ncbi:phosphorothioated DNA-binding restriction endonuclease [Cedecea sp. NFIX57]|uniref:phosphorothioated DNA-binding restriction endonuclease n=1 Tax=Cedecea sp. NFIX57 TaxID=1566286 RepID=UPI000A1CBBD1|nr:HNH endonuclease [Cedecea sp. NFIX57]